MNANLLDFKRTRQIPRSTALRKDFGSRLVENFSNCWARDERHVWTPREAGTKRQISRSFDVTSLSLIGQRWWDAGTRIGPFEATVEAWMTRIGRTADNKYHDIYRTACNYADFSSRHLEPIDNVVCSTAFKQPRTKCIAGDVCSSQTPQSVENTVWQPELVIKTKCPNALGRATHGALWGMVISPKIV